MHLRTCRKPLWTWMAACATALTACGGGGGSGGDAPDTTLPVLTSAFVGKDATVQVARITVAGTATDNTALKSVVVAVNGVQTTATLTGTSGSYALEIALKAGNNAYTITATDAAGNQSKQTGNVYLGKRVAAGGAHSGAIVNGKLYTWGRNNFGQTGLGYVSTLAANPSTHPAVPTLAASSNTFVALAFNQNQSIALDQSGKLWSWGDDTNGQLGRGEPVLCPGSTSNRCRLDIGQITGVDNVVAVSAGYRHTLALRADGTVWGFGLNTNGQLGDGSSTTRSLPVQVQWATADAPKLGAIVQVSASASSSYALDNKGQVWAWGRNQYANLGQGTVSTDVNSTPVLVPMPAGVKVTSIANGRDHVIALTDTGKVYAWGLNATSQVGFSGYKHKGTTSEWPSPVTSPRSLPALETNPAVEVYANGNTSYVRRADGKLYPWGMYGATEGTGATTYADLDEPEDRLPSLTGISDLAVGALHQVALRNDGKLFTWGWSFEGSLGGGSTALNAWMYNLPLAPVVP